MTDLLRGAMLMLRQGLLVGCVVILAACGGDDGDGGDNPPPTNTIEVLNNQFNPSALTVSAGTTVTFTWASGSINHNVVPWASNSAAIPASPGQPTLLDAPNTFGVTFPAAGTFRFFCSAHGSVGSAGQLSGMAGIITVQ
jgi:plastocyanin